MSQNNLQNQKSAYLAQHKDNPVHWHPYSKEIIEKAKNENKPIFLSIGYSSCHWCHVMSHESFEDQVTADFLNENFINIKIDREEHPDIDNYYQMAAQITSQRGGWPLSAFLLPDMRPFFVGTYFPKVTQGQMPSFMDVAKEMSTSFKEDFKNMEENANNITTAIKQLPEASEKVEFEGHFPAPAAIINAIKNYEDADNGGYGAAPKFPQFSFYEFAIEQILEGMIPEEFGTHIVLSVEKMLMGGMYDHAKGGVHRYSVDEKWLVPHFEKMLYDQAGLLRLLIKTSLIYPSPLVYDGIIQTLEYLRSEMLSEQGYFFSGQDADSEGVEGLYFTFTKDEFMDAIVDHDEKLSDHMDNILKWFKITDKGNFEKNLNVISLDASLKEDIYGPENWEIVRSVRVALLEARKDRIPPMTDNKGVASWNFQLLTALLDVIQYSRVEVITKSAYELLSENFEKIHEVFMSKKDELSSRIHTTTSNEDITPLFEDYVSFVETQLRFYELSGSESFKQNAKGTLDFIFDHFYKEGAFFTRSLSENKNREFENIHTPIFDQSYKSSLSTLILLLRKWEVSLDLQEEVKKISAVIETLTHLSLQNPLAFGETLRALTYPDMAFKNLEVPRSWINNNMIQRFYPHFSSRFCLNYTDSENEWQICNKSACEQSGSDFESFAKIFTPKENDQA
ncbi:MAG: DUF255 domain-containing protein [Bacteriovoracaceae bacterium]|jgi:uncharacterized protein YyaL (SSP411 family)|nr:DUF255 domain-containing protein [Bacteriovoracaceae bacterium]